MVANMVEVNRHCYVSLEEEELLTAPQNPIVLMKWRDDSSVSREVAPNLQYLGVMLPYTPLHHILLRDTQLPLVMTSGNLSEEPIAKDNDEALRRLSGIADYFLIHNRDIYSRYDDSVAMVERKTNQLVRRARSYAPYPITLPFKTKQVLGCGAEMKNTFCLTRDSYAFLSQHIGDLENWETMEHFVSTISLYKRLFHIQPEIIAYDLHPDYLSTKYAQELGEAFATSQGSLCIKLIPVQHHHAHIASCMADNGLETPVVGVAFDGTGLGSDEHIWGGEFLVADYQSFNRMGHLEYLPLPGGDAAIKRPYRTAIGYILSLLGENALNEVTLKERVNEVEVGIIKRQIETGLNSPLNSSMGRLFDAVSALIGIRDKVDYEGQAAIELEMAAYSCHCKEHVSRSSEPFASCHSEGAKRPKNLAQGKLREEDEAISDDKESYPYHIIEDKGIKVVKLAILLSAIIGDLSQGTPQGRISIRFHNTIAKMTNEICQVIANETGIKQVALSGGVFQNRLLLRKTVNLLENNGFQVFTHRQVPCNDGGVSLGQAVIANFAK